MDIQVKTTDIQWCIKGLNPGPHAYNELRHIVGDDIKFFAQCLVGNGYYQWNCEEDSLKALSELNLEQKTEVDNLMCGLVARLTDRIGNETSAQLLTCTPSEKYVWVKLNNGRVESVVLTAWGCRALGKTPPLVWKKKFFVSKAHPVNIAFVDNGLPIPYRDFTIKHEYKDNEEKTDQSGFINIGNSIVPNTVLRVQDIPTGKMFEIVVEDEKEDYLLDVTDAEDAKELITDYSIMVVNQEGTISPHYELLVQNKPVETNDDAKYIQTNYAYTRINPTITVSDSRGNRQEYKLSEEPHRNQFVFKWDETFYSSLNVNVQYEDGTAVPNRNVYLRNSEGTQNGVTDKYGCWLIDKLEDGAQVEVSAFDDFRQSQSIKLQRGKNELTIILEQQKKNGPHPEPDPKMVRIGIADIDAKPIPELTVSIVTGKGSFSAVTDANGNLWLPVENFEHRKKARISFTYKGKEYSQKVSK